MTQKEEKDFNTLNMHLNSNKRVNKKDHTK